MSSRHTSHGVCGSGKFRAFRGKVGRTLYINWNYARLPKPSNLENSTKRAQKEYWEQKLNADPYYKIYGRVRKYDDWREMFQKVEEYFESCNGIIYGKFGPLMDADGKPLIGQVRAYSMPGLCLFLGISRETFCRYAAGGRNGTYPPEFALVCEYAKQRIEDYYAQQLMTRDGQRGAQFALQCAYKWLTPKEQAEIRKIDNEIEVMRQDLVLRKQAQEAKLKVLEDAQADGNVEIRITRVED